LLVAGCFFMENLDGTIVTTAAPRIGADLHVPSSSVGLVITVYLMTLAVLIPLSGWMTARFGTRKVFLAAISRSRLPAQGGTVLDPEVVRQLLGAGRRADSLAALTPREREVLSLIAQGRSNAAIAGALFISPKVVEKHVANIFDKLCLAQSDSDNRRVIAAIRFLES
jgi:DNA-binding CsgD family transcriptional regulator